MARTTQTIVVAQEELDPSVRVKQTALFNPDGSPFTGEGGGGTPVDVEAAIEAYLTGLDGYADGAVLTATTDGFAWVTPEA